MSDPEPAAKDREPAAAASDRPSADINVPAPHPLSLLRRLLGVALMLLGGWGLLQLDLTETSKSHATAAVALSCICAFIAGAAVFWR
jgi:hypothetical protein